MKWNKSTRFALYAAIEMAAAGNGLVTIPAVADKYRISAHHLAKVMQQLQRAGIAASVRGVGGGYRLTRPAREITLLDVVEVFEGRVDLKRCLLTDEPEPCGNVLGCRLKRVFDEIEQQAFFTLKSVRLSTMVGAREPGPARR
jgi:Rrf2 family protein